jgi:hypothetical protein
VSLTTGITRAPAVPATITSPCCRPVVVTVAAGPPTVVRAVASAGSRRGVTVTVAAASLLGSSRTVYVPLTAGPKVSIGSTFPVQRVSEGRTCFPLGKNRLAVTHAAGVPDMVRLKRRPLGTVSVATPTLRVPGNATVVVVSIARAAVVPTSSMM